MHGMLGVHTPQRRLRKISGIAHPAKMKSLPRVTQGSLFAKKAGSTSNTVYLESVSSLRISVDGVLRFCKTMVTVGILFLHSLILTEARLAVIGITQRSFQNCLHLYHALFI